MMGKKCSELFLLFSLALTLLAHFHLASASARYPITAQTRSREGFEEAVKDFIGKWDNDHRHHRIDRKNGHFRNADASNEETDEATTSTTALTSSDEEQTRINSVATTTEHLPSSETTHFSNVTSTSTSSNCTRCVPHQDAKALRLNAIKAQILDKLRLSSPPNITRSVILSMPPVREMLNNLNFGNVMQGDSPAILDEPHSRHFNGDTNLDELSEYDDDDYHLNTEKVISLAQNPPASFQHPKQMGSMFFNFAQNLFSYHVAKAHLWIPVREKLISFSESRPAQLFIYRVYQLKGKPETAALRSYRNRKIIPSSVKDGYLIVDLRKLVAQWFLRPEENFGVVIHLNDAGGQQVKLFDSEDKDHPVPFVEVHLQSSKRIRKKRSLNMICSENSKEVKCCRYPLTVDFEEFGWDWVIAPKRYEANYCSGECPYVFLQTYPHTHLATLVGPQGSTGPCCSSKQLSSISMLYYNPDQGNIVLGTLPNMVVESCGCN